MVAWFIIAIATLAVFAFIAINGVQTVASTTDGVGRVETARRLDAAAAALVARSGSPNNTGRMMVMAGTTVDNVYGLPPELAAYAYTPFGQRIVYCPFGDGESGSSSGAVPSGGGATYPIETRADPSGRIYVTAGRPNFAEVNNNPNLMGYLIAPRTKTSSTPTCSSVRFNASTRRFEAPDAFVRPIIRQSSGEDLRTQATREIVYYVSPTGTGHGLAPNDPSSIYNAITYYRANLPTSMRIVLSAGNHVLPQQYMNATTGGFSDKGNASTLVLDGAAGAQLDFAGTGVSDIWVPGNLEIRNLTISTSVGVYAEQGHKLTLVNTTTGNVRIDKGASLTASNVTINNSRSIDSALIVHGASTASITGNIDINTVAGRHGVWVATGGVASFDTGRIRINKIGGGGNMGYGIMVEDGATANFSRSEIQFMSYMDWPVLIYGQVVMNNNSSIWFGASNPRMFELQRGGKLTLTDGFYGQGTPPVNAIVDAGAAAISGEARIRSNFACWTNAGVSYGVQFVMSEPGNASNQRSRVTDDEGQVGMNPNPTADQVRANADIAARNARRAQLRGTNTSNFVCQIG